MNGFLRLLCAAAAVLATGCLVQEKVTVNGQVEKEGYTVKQPAEIVR